MSRDFDDENHSMTIEELRMRLDQISITLARTAQDNSVVIFNKKGARDKFDLEHIMPKSGEQMTLDFQTKFTSKYAIEVAKKPDNVAVGDPIPSVTLETPPGHRIAIVLQTLLSRRAYERLIGQVLRDSRELYYEALSQGDEVEAKKIKRELNFDLLRVVGSFIIGLPFHLIAQPLSKLFGRGD